jgi:hypothetical protein
MISENVRRMVRIFEQDKRVIFQSQLCALMVFCGWSYIKPSITEFKEGTEMEI